MKVVYLHEMYGGVFISKLMLEVITKMKKDKEKKLKFFVNNFINL